MQKNKLFTIFKMQSDLLLVLAVLMLIPLCIAIYNKESNCIEAFCKLIIFCAIFGLVGHKVVPASSYKLKTRDGFLVVSIMWLLASIVCAFPYYLSGEISDFINSFFEAVSGLTTTGATVLKDVETIPASLIFWRSFTNWIGGMGLIVLITALIPSFGINGQIIANAETPGPIKDKVSSKFSDTSKILYMVYGTFTIAEIILLKICGLSWFDSIVHSFSTVSTGGFSSYNDSIAHFQSPIVCVIIMAFMILSAINFELIYLSRKKGIKHILKDEETKFFLGVLTTVAILITLFNLFKNGLDDAGNTVLNSFFNVSSFITTTGFNSYDYEIWPAFAKLLLFALFIVGGCSSSSSCGLKSIRVLIGLKLVVRSFEVKMHPNIMARITLNKSDLGNDVVIRISNFIFAYLSMALIGTLLLSINNFDFTTTLSASLACLGNIGHGFGLIGPSGTFADFSIFSKLVCSFLMIVGRLEIYTVTALFSKRYWNSNIM